MTAQRTEPDALTVAGPDGTRFDLPPVSAAREDLWGLTADADPVEVDEARPVVGWRFGDLVPTGIAPFDVPGETLTTPATCRSNYPSAFSVPDRVHRGGPVPGVGCTCGYRMVKRLATLVEYYRGLRMSEMIIGAGRPMMRTNYAVMRVAGFGRVMGPPREDYPDPPRTLRVARMRLLEVVVPPQLEEAGEVMTRHFGVPSFACKTQRDFLHLTDDAAWAAGKLGRGSGDPGTVGISLPDVFPRRADRLAGRSGPVLESGLDVVREQI